ncbi:MAG: choice-of-anchor R domain-containing protein [Planctomycetia bacterium]
MRRTLARCAWTVAVVAGGLMLSTAHAAPVDIYGNLGTVNVNTTSNTAGYLSQAQQNQYQAQGFSVGPQVGNSAWNIQQIDVGLGSSGSPSPVMQIYSDASGTPGSVLSSFTTSSTVSSKQVYSFTGSFVAQQNTSYWVVLSNANSASQESYEWYSNDAFTNPTTHLASGVSYLGTQESNNLGPWGGTLASLSIALYATSTSTAVPEIDPSSFGSALALLAGSLGLLERRARRLVGLMA